MRYRMGNVISKLVMVGLVLVAGFVLRSTYEQIVYPSKPAVAQADQYDCASFGSRGSAQVELDSDPSDPNNLDSDGNGIACDDYAYGTSGSVAASSVSPSSPSPSSAPERTTEQRTAEQAFWQRGIKQGVRSAQTTKDPPPIRVRWPHERTSPVDGEWRVSGRVSGKTRRPLPRVAFQHAPCRALSALQHASASGCRLSARRFAPFSMSARACTCESSQAEVPRADDRRVAAG